MRDHLTDHQDRALNIAERGDGRSHGQQPLRRLRNVESAVEKPAWAVSRKSGRRLAVLTAEGIGLIGEDAPPPRKSAMTMR